MMINTIMQVTDPKVQSLKHMKNIKTVQLKIVCTDLIYLIFDVTGFLFKTSGILQICYGKYFAIEGTL